ncbi:hypothetical protein PIB30_093752 [Stylosanthes scabra]|uniref:RNA-directed RNA polymerase n=1 Tax=Stylosanthes scabra TaxID=79078 RepID=A0ABU6SWE1_9FABA|nr:hypothetical protein [Stylosanthes scabra]
MSDESCFLVLVHHSGKILKNSKVGIRFSSEEPISVFMRSSTTLAELQNTILQKLGVARSKRISKLFYRASVAVLSEHVKYGSFVVQTDADLEVIFHCRRDFQRLGRLSYLQSWRTSSQAPADPTRFLHLLTSGVHRVRHPLPQLYQLFHHLLHLLHSLLTYITIMTISVIWRITAHLVS